jgi:hypothetical protein
LPGRLAAYSPYVHASVFLIHIIEDPKFAHPQFPNRCFVIKGGCQIHQALTLPSRYGRLLNQLPADFPEHTLPVKHAESCEFLKCQLVDFNFVRHDRSLLATRDLHGSAIVAETTLSE